MHSKLKNNQNMNIRKKPLRKRKSEIGDHGAPTEEIVDDFKEPETWTIITALNRVLDAAQCSRLSDEYWEECKNPLAFLRQELGLTNVQIVVLAIMIETGESISWKQLSNYLGCSRLSVMVYSDEIEGLVAKRWATRRIIHEYCGNRNGFALARGVVKALRHNQVFVPESIENLSEQQFVDKLESHISKNQDDVTANFDDDEEWMQQLVKANPHLPLCHEILKFKDIHVQSLLLMIVFDYAQWEGSEDEGLTLEAINSYYPEEYMRQKLRDGKHPLIQRGYIEYKCVDGQIDTDQYLLTRKTKAELLSEYKPRTFRSSPPSPSKWLTVKSLQ